MAKYKLNDIAPIIQGEVSKQEAYWLLNLDMVESNTGRIVDYLYVRESEIGSSTVTFDTSNVLYSKLRPYLNKVVLPDRFGYATSEMLPLRPNENVITREYLTYFLRSPHFVAYINEKTSGAKMPRANSSDLKAVEIECPSIDEQKKIVGLFDKIAAIIALRQQELEKLDDLIKARFVELFGDESKYSKEPLNDNVQEMFIGPFGSALKNEYFVEKEQSYCMVYEQKHAIQKTMDLPTRYVNEKKYNELKRFTVLGGDIIVSCRGTIGEIYSVPDDAPMGIMHPSIMKIRLKKDKYCNLFFVLMLEQYMQASMAKANGSGIKMAVTATDLGKEMFVVPPLDDQRAFADFVKQVDKSKSAVQKALKETQLLFDSLMQQYFG